DELMNLVQFDVGVKSLALELEIDKSAELILNTDPIRLKQILLNLLNNAIKFTSSGSITVKVWQQDSSTIFNVTDTGIGI
ncbi:ATP-binding protein, partial [Streptomyces scabiei]